MSDTTDTATGTGGAGGNYDFRESHFERLHTALHQLYEAKVEFRDGDLTAGAMAFEDGVGNVEAVLEELADGEVDDRDE